MTRVAITASRSTPLWFVYLGHRGQRAVVVDVAVVVLGLALSATFRRSHRSDPSV
jgi:hypothetical protein